MFDGGVPLDWTDDPLEMLARWPKDKRIFMLHSARPDTRWSLYTVLAEPADAVRHQAGQTQLSNPSSELPGRVTLSHNPFTDLRRLFDADAGRSLWLGSLGYDLARSIEHLPHPANNDRGWPDFQLERCETWYIHDNQTQCWTAHGDLNHATPTLSTSEASGTQARFEAGPIESDQPEEQVKQSIQRVIDYIAAGDVFQVNLAQRFAGPFAGNPRALYAALCQWSPAWYGAYGEFTRFDEQDPLRTLASISPELFLQADAQRNVTTRPIKGTRPGSDDTASLRDSEKDQAELAMIVDLMRNDLGRVCSYGSIQVDDPRSIESHPTVHHGVATITGRLHPSRDLIDLLYATLPGGSITGAPKVRAMQIIDELEPARRGPYCGAIGMIHGQQALLNIAIRTVMIEQSEQYGEGRADVWAGGGIVADSQPDSEYQEMLDKAKVMRDALAAGSLSNTPKYQPAEL
ncbi:MAG: anthranilate synthase component I family protein [Planctomycetota bacterium]